MSGVEGLLILEAAKWEMFSQCLQDRVSAWRIEGIFEVYLDEQRFIVSTFRLAARTAASAPPLTSIYHRILLLFQ